MSEPDVERSEIDGVTVLRVDSPTGRSGAALIFRVGRFGETLPVAGITHLVEHLAFCGGPWPRYQFNGSVDGRFTTFAMTTSDPGDIQGFVARVCEGLTSDWSAEIERESRVLRTEAASRGQGMASSCLAERHGAAGPGLAACDEFGLIKPDWERVEQWRGQWFVAGNGTLCVLGDLPSDLRVPLPPGTAPELAPLRSYAEPRVMVARA